MKAERAIWGQEYAFFFNAFAMNVPDNERP